MDQLAHSGSVSVTIPERQVYLFTLSVSVNDASSMMYRMKSQYGFYASSTAHTSATVIGREMIMEEGSTLAMSTTVNKHI